MKLTNENDILVAVMESSTGYFINSLILQGFSLGEAEDAIQELLDSHALGFGTYEPWELEVVVGARAPRMSDYRLYPVFTWNQVQDMLDSAASNAAAFAGTV